MENLCPTCGRVTGGKRFCPFCGAERTEPMTSPLPPPLLKPSVEQPAPMQVPPRKKRTALWVSLVAVAVLAVAGAVAAVILLSGGKTSIAIINPADNSDVSGRTVKVEAEIGGSGVLLVEVLLDGEKRATMRRAPYEAEIESVPDGAHDLELIARDSAGKQVARATCAFETRGGKSEDDEGTLDPEKARVFTEALARGIDEAEALGNKISALANRINSEVDFTARRVPNNISVEAQNLYAQSLELIAGARALAPPADMQNIRSEYEKLLEYLKVRAEALQKGLKAITAGGDYKAEFDKGGAAKSSFDAAWPSFISSCRSLGIAV